MPLTLNGSGGITYPDGTVNTTRSVSTAGDTMTGALATPGIISGSANSSTGIHTSAGGASSSSASVMVWGKSMSSWGGGVHIIADGTSGTVDGNIRFFRYDGGSTWTQLLHVSKNGGVTFPSTQLSNSDPNTLDDYEEGTFTPTILGTGGNPSVSFSLRNGFYRRIGDMVYFEIRCWFSSKSGGAGEWSVGGLPFAAGAMDGYLNRAFPTRYDSVSNTTTSFGFAMKTDGSTGMTMWDTTGRRMQVADLVNTSYFTIWGSYIGY